MNLRLEGFILLIFVLGTSAKPRVDDDQVLPKLDHATSKSLKSDSLDFDEASGNYEDDEDDEEYFFDDYDEEEEEDGSGEYEDDDEDEDYDDVEDEEEEVDTTGKLVPDPYPKGDMGGVAHHGDDDWHFNDGHLYEYYNELYEEDYELRDDEDEGEMSTEPPPKGEEEEEKEEDHLTNYATPEKVLNTSNLLLMVASGLASFAICTLAFFVCCYKQKSSALSKRVHAMAPFYVSSSFGPNAHNELGATTVRCFAPPSTSIVKNYHLVPQDTKEFISSSGMLNSTHIVKETGQRSSKESEKPLLP